MKLRPYLLIGLFVSLLLGNLTLFVGNSISAELADRAIAAPPPSAVVSSTASLSLTKGVKKTILNNGLTVLTKEVHTAPVVSVQVWYRVGSRNEVPGINGISHQLEHLMFKGTQARPIQFGRLFSALGSESNAFTSYDETAYFGTVERSKLEALMTLEADRMQNTVIGPEQLESEKRVVISELQGYENSPGYRLSRAVMRAAFPNSPYGMSVGGTKADVEKFTVEQVQNHYKTYYRPENATLVVTGDFNTAAALKMAEQTFGKLPKATEPLPSVSATPSARPSAASPKAPIVLKQPGSTALMNAIYPLPDVNHPDVPAIDLMDAVLTGGRSSRLYQELVETGLASSVGAYASQSIDLGWYSISAVAASGQPLSRVEAVLQQSLAEIRQKPVTAEELERAKVQFRASLILGNQDISSQATQLGYNQTVAGDYRFIDRYLAAMERVTPKDILRVAQTYLKPERQTIGFFEPILPDGRPGASSAGNTTERTTENFSPGKPVDPAEVAKYLPPVRSATAGASNLLPQDFKLSNGLRVLLLPDRSAPTVNLSGNIRAGSIFDVPAKAGVAGLTASNLMNGTESKSALALAKSLEDRGASLGFGASREGVGIGGSALVQDLPILVQTLADVLLNPTFPEKQLELSRQRSLVGLKAALDDPGQLGRRTFQQAIYPENHPFHTFPTEDSLKRITREDLALFHQRYYRPDTTVLSLVGDFDPVQVKLLLESALGRWRTAGQPPALNFPPVGLPKTTTYVSKSIPGKAEAVTYLGYSGLSRRDPRYYAAVVLNQVLGGDTLSSRLGTEIRDRLGLTYGISSGFSAGQNPGPFLISMQTAPKDVRRAIDSTVALLRQLREQGITATELDNAKRSIQNSYPVELASPSSVANAILSDTVMGLGLEELRQFPIKIGAVTAEQVEQVIQEFIQPDRLVIVTSGPGTETIKRGG
ncbi:M16 family metallopeptidase [Altericista sp. CCNU0014]|uniref:M16 family metallopeptidase n=1 Tax=Altericista sp. CCNU0014 TaxID=3082949 RepID=UPI00384DF277